MTPRGFEVFDAAHADARDIAAGLVGHLGPGEADRLMDLLTRFTYPPVADDTEDASTGGEVPGSA